jgi:fructose-1,6-bisphosphatase/inositol monophosphatase family enzyme
MAETAQGAAHSTNEWAEAEAIERFMKTRLPIESSSETALDVLERIDDLTDDEVRQHVLRVFHQHTFHGEHLQT